MLLLFAQGFAIGGGLIVAIGAQNAFVLARGIHRHYAVTVALICALSDMVLISIGVAGMGGVVASSPLLTRVAAWGGAAFLICYGFGALRAALRGNVLVASEEAPPSLRAVVLTTLAVTLLNPHVYIDTILFMGSISAQFAGTGRAFFGAGAIAASFVWFFGLALCGRLLAPLFRKRMAWRILDGTVCAVMWTIATSLIVRTLNGGTLN